jgi:hypothetical protein
MREKREIELIQLNKRQWGPVEAMPDHSQCFVNAFFAVSSISLKLIVKHFQYKEILHYLSVNQRYYVVSLMSLINIQNISYNVAKSYPLVRGKPTKTIS